MTVEDPFAAHLISQIEQNVQLLASQSYLSQADADEILRRLPVWQHESAARAAPPNAISQLSNKFSKIVSPSSSNQGRAVPPPPSPAPLVVVQAKALWGYNEACEDPKDLTFAAGDIIEIVEETNSDWWVGRVDGRQGLVPVNYVQKIAAVPAPSFPQPPEAPGATTSSRPYRPFGAAYHGVNNNGPPPAGQAVNSSGLQQSPETEEKKDKYGGLKNTMAHSAAGGVGFGAGAAIGGGLIRAIF